MNLGCGELSPLECALLFTAFKGRCNHPTDNYRVNEQNDMQLYKQETYFLKFWSYFIFLYSLSVARDVHFDENKKTTTKKKNK